MPPAAGFRHADGGHHLAGPQRGAAVAEDEFGKRQMARRRAPSAARPRRRAPAAPARRRRPARRCRDCRRWRRRSGSATEPTSRAACFSASKAGGSGWRTMSVQVVRAPMTKCVIGLGDAAQRRQAVDVENILAERLCALRRIEIRAAGKDAPRRPRRAARAPRRPWWVSRNGSRFAFPMASRGHTSRNGRLCDRNSFVCK